ncbi:MAG: hydrogenase maturation protease [Thermomicrobiales bacterium]
MTSGAHGRRILVAGIGNIFFGDDAFGVEVVNRLASRDLPAGVIVSDFGIRGFDLAFALLDGYDAAILVDATPRGGEPGTLYVIEPDLAASPTMGQLQVETHNLDPVKVLRLARSFGGPLPPRIVVAGCEPATLGTEDEGQLGLSDPIAAVIEPGVALVESLIARLLADQEVTGSIAIMTKTPSLIACSAP